MAEMGRLFNFLPLSSTIVSLKFNWVMGSSHLQFDSKAITACNDLNSVSDLKMLKEKITIITLNKSLV